LIINKALLTEFDWETWISAEESEYNAKKLHDEAKKHPIANIHFLDSAKYSRKAAEFYKLAEKSSNNFFMKYIAKSNHHASLANNFKALADFFYYSGKPERAIIFYERNVKQLALSALENPLELEKYMKFMIDYIRNTWEIYSVIFDCKGLLEKRNDDWIRAQKNFEVAKRKNEELKQITTDPVRLKNIEATFYSIEREIQICQTMIALEKNDLAQALKHADSAIISAEKALEKHPTWIFYQKILIPTVSLKAKIESYLELPKTPTLERKYEATIEKFQSFIDNLLAYKFEQEVENFLRKEHGYVYSWCRYKPPYLGKELDVYASKGGKHVTITICECKLRLGDQPITEEEIQYFSNKTATVRQYEQQKANKEGKQVRIYLWFITNADKVEEEAIKLAKKNRIEIKRASIPKRDNLLSNPAWTVTKVENLV